MEETHEHHSEVEVALADDPIAQQSAEAVPAQYQQVVGGQEPQTDQTQTGNAKQETPHSQIIRCFPWLVQSVVFEKDDFIRRALP